MSARKATPYAPECVPERASLSLSRHLLVALSVSLVPARPFSLPLAYVSAECLLNRRNMHEREPAGTELCYGDLNGGRDFKYVYAEKGNGDGKAEVMRD